MKIFSEVTEQMLALLPEAPDKTADFSEELCAQDGEKNAILFRSDTAYELGGSGKALYAVSCLLICLLLVMRCFCTGRI